MNRNRFASSTTKTMTSSKKMKAKCAQNQQGLDRLQELNENTEEKNPNSNYVLTIQRAMKSLRDCPTEITTAKEACALKFIGPSMSKIICPRPPLSQVAPPPLLTTTTTTAPPPLPGPSTSSVPAPNLLQSTLTGGIAAAAIAATTTIQTKRTAARKEQGPTNKQRTYEREVQKADNLDLASLKGPWKVILLVDGREHKSKHVVAKCKQSGIPCEERHLAIGDMTWIARSEHDQVEIMCGTIVERKESADLVSSLFGTRYLEQRLRLQNCGLPQLLFLVEGDLTRNSNCPMETLHMAMMETRALGFHAIHTNHLQDTVRHLKGLHRRIVQRTFPQAFSSELPTFSNSPPIESRGRNRRRRRPTSLLEMVFDGPPVPPLDSQRFMTYGELKAKVEMDREAGTKTMGAIYMAMCKLCKLRSIFICFVTFFLFSFKSSSSSSSGFYFLVGGVVKQVSTLSHKKCEAIASYYPTIHSLMTAFTESSDSSSSSSSQPQTLVRDIPCGSQKVGPKAANELYLSCCMGRDGSLLPTTSLVTASNKTMRNEEVTFPITKRPRTMTTVPTFSTTKDMATTTATASTGTGKVPTSPSLSCSSSSSFVSSSSPKALPFLPNNNNDDDTDENKNDISCIDLTVDTPEMKKVTMTKTKSPITTTKNTVSTRTKQRNDQTMDPEEDSILVLEFENDDDENANDDSNNDAMVSTTHKTNHSISNPLRCISTSTTEAESNAAAMDDDDDDGSSSIIEILD